VKSKLLLLMIPSIAIASPVKLETMVKDVYGQAGQSVYIACSSRVMIDNSNHAELKLVLGTKLCAENQGCQDHRLDIKVHDNENYTNSYGTVFMPTFKRTGNKQITCTNYIEGDIMASEIKYATAYIS
jgi:hypothetical protein